MRASDGKGAGPCQERFPEEQESPDPEKSKECERRQQLARLEEPGALGTGEMWAQREGGRARGLGQFALILKQQEAMKQLYPGLVILD